MVEFHISPAVKDKLEKKHDLDRSDLKECIANRTGGYLIDTSEKHATSPPTQWFISKTDKERIIILFFMYFQNEERIELKTAFNAVQKRIDIYKTKFPDSDL